MNHQHSVSGRMAYSRKLVHAGVEGIRMGRHSLHDEAVYALMASSARDSVKLAAAGACLGLLPSCFGRRRQSLSALLAFGVLGSAVGFVAAFTWKTREIAARLANPALKELHRVSDEHWLERNPVDYA